MIFYCNNEIKIIFFIFDYERFHWISLHEIPLEIIYYYSVVVYTVITFLLINKTNKNKLPTYNKVNQRYNLRYKVFHG